MSNYYAQAIQILADNTTDFKALVFEVAKANPGAIVAADGRLRGGFGWQKECHALMAAGQKIPAIKRCREITGMGLREAKDAVEALGCTPPQGEPGGVGVSHRGRRA